MPAQINSCVPIRNWCGSLLLYYLSLWLQWHVAKVCAEAFQRISSFSDCSHWPKHLCWAQWLLAFHPIRSVFSLNLPTFELRNKFQIRLNEIGFAGCRCNRCCLSGFNIVRIPNQMGFHRLQWHPIRGHDYIHDIRTCCHVLPGQNFAIDLCIVRCIPVQYLLDLWVSLVLKAIDQVALNES